jgi:glyoxylase-like metal-dependent hydrolase (beta-lactamase superfamily II)
VFVHESDWLQSNSVIVRGRDGVLLIDAGIHGGEMVDLANDLAALGLAVVAGFSTHPHWDHLLWHAAFGAAPRYATAVCAATAVARLAGGLDTRRAQLGIPDDTPLELVGDVIGLATGATQLPWDGPVVRILEHRAHAPGHAALLVEEHGVLVSGDMLSDVLIPMPDLAGAENPLGDYLSALDLLESVVDDVDFVIPGHGSIGDGIELQARIDRDRAYLLALNDGREITDPRIGPEAKPGWDWVGGLHARQVESLARGRDRDEQGEDENERRARRG